MRVYRVMTYRNGSLLIDGQGINSIWTGELDDKEALRKARAESVGKCQTGDRILLVHTTPGEERIVADYKVKKLRDYIKAVFS